MSLNVWNIYVNTAVAIIVLIIFCLVSIAALIYIFHQKSSQDKPHLLRLYLGQKALVTIGLLITVNIPWIISDTQLILFRIVFVASATFILLLWWAISAIVRLLSQHRH